MTYLAHPPKLALPFSLQASEMKMPTILELGSTQIFKTVWYFIEYYGANNSYYCGI